MHLGRPGFWSISRPLPPPLSGFVRITILTPPSPSSGRPELQILRLSIDKRMTKYLYSLGIEYIQDIK